MSETVLRHSDWIHAGKHVIVTGATSGIGEATAWAVAQTGATLTLISRNAEKLADTAAHIAAVTGNPHLDTITADLSQVVSSRHAAEIYRDRHDRLDVLVNNAGSFFRDHRVNPEGVEMNVALNHLSAFVLTNQLIEMLVETSLENPAFGARIVNVASDNHWTGVYWDDIHWTQRPYRIFNAYSQSKAMMLMTSFELARLLDGTGVTVNALQPGVTRTNIFSYLPPLLRTVINGLGRVMFITPERAAERVMRVAFAPDMQGISGKYIEGDTIKDPKPAVRDPADWPRAWQVSTALVQRAVAM